MSSAHLSSPSTRSILLLHAFKEFVMLRNRFDPHPSPLDRGAFYMKRTSRKARMLFAIEFARPAINRCCYVLWTGRLTWELLGKVELIKPTKRN